MVHEKVQKDVYCYYLNEGTDDEKSKKYVKGEFLEEGHHVFSGVVSGNEHVSADTDGARTRGHGR